MSNLDTSAAATPHPNDTEPRRLAAVPGSLHRYNSEADAELARLYKSVGATTAKEKIETLKLALGHDGGNFYATPGPVTDEMKQGVLEYEYLELKNMITPSFL